MLNVLFCYRTNTEYALKSFQNHFSVPDIEVFTAPHIFQSRFQDNVTKQSSHHALSYIYDNTYTHLNLK